MEEQLIGIKNAAVSLILDTDDPKALEEVKLQFLGRGGKLTLALKDLPKVPKEKRPDVGRLANEVKLTIEQAFERQESRVKNLESRKRKESIDTSAPGILPHT